MSTQSSTGRRAAEAELLALITKFSPAYQRLVGTVRRWLLKRMPTAYEAEPEGRVVGCVIFAGR